MWQLSLLALLHFQSSLSLAPALLQKRCDEHMTCEVSASAHDLRAALLNRSGVTCRFLVMITLMPIGRYERDFPFGGRVRSERPRG